jgi:PadR family transcriptional regulator, regulatory protein PadR
MYSKELVRGTLKPIILKLLSERGKMYGYEICQTIKELTSGQLIIKEGSLYPALYKLKDEGLVKVEAVKVGNRVRQYYSLARSGNAVAKQEVNEFSLFLKTMTSLFKKELST